MKNIYRVCLIAPEGYPHSLCFREVALLLTSAISGNGFSCDFALNQLKEDRINIILGYHLLKPDSRLKNYRYIPYQLEQLHSEEISFSPNSREILHNSYQIWDYSVKNIRFLQDQGLEARHLPIGYHSNLELINNSQEKDVDILFYGSLGERRKKVLDELAGKYQLKVLFGVYGQKRDDWISRSRIILNIHHYSKKIFEAVRTSYLLNNGCFIISELSENYPYDKVKLPMVSYEHITDACAEYLNDPVEREKLGRQNYIDFKTSYPMEEMIKPLLN